LIFSGKINIKWMRIGNIGQPQSILKILGYTQGYPTVINSTSPLQTYGNLIAALGRIGSTVNWDIHIIKISDKTDKRLNLTNSITFAETSTPSFWIKK